MYKYILVPLDGSRLSQSVIPYATQIAQALDIPVVLLNVIESLSVYVDQANEALDMVTDGRSQEYKHAIETSSQTGHVEYIRYLDLIIDREKAVAQRYLSLFAHPIEAEDVKVEFAVEIGKPAQAILDYVEQHPDGLIAISTHGRSGLGRIAMGSVADKIVHTSSVPVLLVRPIEQTEPVDGFESIVVPLDGSPLSESVMPTVRYLDRSLDLPVHLVRAISISSEIWAGGEPYSFFPAYLASEVQTKMQEDAMKYLEHSKAALEGEKIRADLRVLVGSADDRIVDYASEAKGALIIMATHGRSGLSRWLLGSIAEKVVRTSGRPVLLIRPSEE